MKPNRLLRVFREGRVPVGHMVGEFATRNLASILAACDVDFVILDSEHGALDVGNVADVIAWLRATDITPIVRIPQMTDQMRLMVSRVLDAGAAGVLVPDVKTAQVAARIVEAAMYPPLGQRGMGYSAAQEFKGIAAQEWVRFSNENMLIFCMVESQESVDNLEAIASTPGVGGLWVGHNDMTRDMGILGEFHHERFLRNLRQVCDVAQRHNLPAGTQPSNVDQMREWRAIGFTCFSYASDAAVYLQAVKQGVATFRQALA